MIRRVLWVLTASAASSPLGAIQAQDIENRNAAESAAVEAHEAAPSEYERMVGLAFREYELGNYAEARAGFLEAHRLSPSARTYRALGMVEYELKNYGDAIERLRQALSCVRPSTTWRTCAWT
jgi:tetratricopeptide (TPR) repeat protein